MRKIQTNIKEVKNIEEKAVDIRVITNINLYGTPSSSEWLL